MKNFATRFLLPVTLLTASAHGHSVAYPHGHPHGATVAWADVLITGGVIGVMMLVAAAVFRLRERQEPIRRKIR